MKIKKLAKTSVAILVPLVGIGVGYDYQLELENF